MSRPYIYRIRKRGRQITAEERALRAKEFRLAHPGYNAAVKKAYRQRHPDRIRSAKRDHYRRNRQRETIRRYQRLYGLSPERHAALMAAQNSKCAICRHHPKPGHLLSLDHDHATGKPRGLLCHQCNRGLGQFKDDIGRIQAALDYLAMHSGSPTAFGWCA